VKNKHMHTILTLAGIAFVVFGCFGIALGQRMLGEDSAKPKAVAAMQAAGTLIDSNTTAPIYVMPNTRFVIRNDTGASQYATVERQHDDAFTWQVYAVPHGATSQPISSDFRGCRVQLSAANNLLRVVKQ
jgi:hypothetical protein